MEKNKQEKRRMIMKKLGILLTVILLCSLTVYSKQEIFDPFICDSMKEKSAKAAEKEQEAQRKTEIEAENEKSIEEKTPENMLEEGGETERNSEESETAPETELEKESEIVLETESEKESETVPEIESEKESESEPETESEKESETAPETESEKESETETEVDSEKETPPFDVILLLENGRARAAGQAQVDTFGQIEILGARTSYKHNKETFQTIYCLNYARNGAYGIYGSDRTSPVHSSITYVLAKGMKMAKNNETMDAKYRGNDDLESYYITQMALHLVNGAIGGEEDISHLLDSSKNPAV